MKIIDETKLQKSDENELNKELSYYAKENSIIGQMPEPVIPKDTEYFGYILSKDYERYLTIRSIVPRIEQDINGEDMIYHEFTAQDLEDFHLNRTLPLVFKRIESGDTSLNLAQEIISGKVFRFYDEDEIVENLCPRNDDTPVFFEEHKKEFMEFPLIITTIDGVVHVDATYKELVAQESLAHKDEIIELFNKMENIAKKNFTKVYLEQMDKLQDIANVENIMKSR